MTRNISYQIRVRQNIKIRDAVQQNHECPLYQMQAGLTDKLKTLLGNFKFEYSLTKDDIRRRRLVKNQVMIFGSSFMPVTRYSMRAEQRHYGRNNIVTPVIYQRPQAGATGSNGTPAALSPQCVVL